MLIKKLKNKIITDAHFYLVYIPFAGLICCGIMLLLCYPQAASDGFRHGLDICLNMLLPSIFPFLFLSSMVINLRLFDSIGKKMKLIMNFIFKLPGEALPIILVSLIGGYPVGAFLIKSAFEKGIITSMQGRRMLLFCVNPGIAFTMSVIGVNLYSSVKIGLTVFAASILSSLTLGVLSRFFEEGNDVRKKSASDSVIQHVSVITLDTMNTCIRSTVNICAWITVFSCLSSLLDVINMEAGFSEFIKMICEVTNGVMIARSNYSIAVLLAILGFGGFCIHLQILPVLISLKLNYKYFLCSRIICGALNCILSLFISSFFQSEIPVMSYNTKCEAAIFSSSDALCAFLVIMCGLFVLGDSFTVYRKKKNISAKSGNRAQ